MFSIFKFLFHCKLFYSYYYYLFFSLPASSVVPNPNKATRAKDQRKLIAPAINPIMGGPTRNPRKPMVETAAKAVLAGIVLDRPAIPYTTGTTCLLYTSPS